MGTFPDPAIFLLSQRAGLAQLLCAQLYNVPVAELQAPSRGRPRAARARQIAIHLLRQVFRLSDHDLAIAFRRDPSTVRHACQLVARLRKGDDELDATLRWMESHLRRATRFKP